MPDVSPLRRPAAPWRWLVAALVGLMAAAAAGCGGSAGNDLDIRPDLVVTTPVLAAVVSELVGDRATVTVLMGNGVDPHDWSPSAKDIAALRRADLVVTNGLGLEEGLGDALDDAREAGVAVFAATDHLTVRELSATHSHAGGDEQEHDHEHGEDPHFWVDPLSMASAMDGLTAQLAQDLQFDVGDGNEALQARLAELDRTVRTTIERLPVERRVLVTGHESLGYFADRYGLRIVGTVVAGGSSQAEPSAAQLAELKRAVRDVGVPAIFTEVGTPASVVRAVAAETGAAVVELPTHTLPADGRYRSFITGLADTIVDALSP